MLNQFLISFLYFFIFSVCLASLEKFLKRKSDAYLAYMHSAARALSNPSRCFQLSTILEKNFFFCILCRDAATIFIYAK